MGLWEEKEGEGMKERDEVGGGKEEADEIPSGWQKKNK